MPEIKQFVCDRCGKVIQDAETDPKHLCKMHGVVIQGNVYAVAGEDTDGGLVGDNIYQRTCLSPPLNTSTEVRKSMFCIGCLLDVLYADIGDVRDWIQKKNEEAQDET